MNEQLMEMLVTAVEKHNEVQEEIREELKLQNDLIAYYLENGKKVSNACRDEDIYTEVDRMKRIARANNN